MSSRSIRIFGAVVLIVGLGVLVYAWMTRTDSRQDEVLTDLTELASTVEAPIESGAAAIDPPSAGAEDDFPAIVDSAVRDPNQRTVPIGATFEIIETITHDIEAFTQGLEVSNGRLFESTGLVDQSSLRELDLATGNVIRSTAVPDVFAEGLTIVGDTAIQLTWKDGVAYRYDIETFERVDTYTYDGEGWGLCNAGSQLVMSNGTPTLQFRDPATFELLSTVDVTFSGAPVDELNELECVEGTVWANIWRSSLIIEIDSSTGNVLSVLNGRALTPTSVENNSAAVLNGIAYDRTDGTFLLTGKLWPTIYRVRIVDSAQ